MAWTGYNLGVDPEEVVLTLVGFAAQHQIFDIVANPQSILGGVTLAFGLIGFVLLVLLPGSWNFKTIASWFMLFLILIVRPLGEPLFFSDANNVAARSVQGPLCYTGNVDMKECEALHSGTPPQGQSVGDAISENQLIADWTNDSAQTEKKGLSFKVYSPEAIIIHLVNELNYGIAVGLHDLGPRAMERHFASIEAIRRSAEANQPTAYNMSEFLATCGARIPGAAEAAYMTSKDLKKERKEVWDAMVASPMTAADALVLYRNYANYARTLPPELAAQLVPALMCDNDASNCPGNVYAKTVRRGAADIQPDEMETAMGSLLYHGRSGDFTDPQAKISDTMRNLREGLPHLGEQPLTRLTNTNVTLIVPLNAYYLAQSALQNSTSNAVRDSMRVQGAGSLGVSDSGVETGSINNDRLNTRNPIIAAAGFVPVVGPLAVQLADRYIDTTETVLNTAAGAVVVGVAGAAVGAAAGCAAGAVVGTVVPILGNIVGCAAGALLFGKIGAGAGAIAGGLFGNEVIGQGLGIRTDAMRHEDKAFAVSNCAQMHRVVDARMAMSATQLDSFADDVEQLTEDYNDALNAANPNFQALPPQAQTRFILQTVQEAGRKLCAGEIPGRPPYGGSAEECTARVNAQVEQLMAINRNLVAEQSHPVARRMVENAAEPQFQGFARTGLAKLGEFFAPIGIAVKSAIGGFGAGTYSKIMPMIIAYASVIMIILTPIMYMVGLLVPGWASGIIIMPLVVIFYFQLTKVVFTMIGIIAGIFIAAENVGAVTGNTASFADLVLGFAYTSAFILTAFFMFALKNPIAAIQQTAGMADKTSTISGAEALGMAMTGVKAVKMVTGAPKAIAGFAGKASAAGALAGAAGKEGADFLGQAGTFMSAMNDGKNMFGISGDEVKNAHNETLEQFSNRKINKMHTPEDAMAIAQHRMKKADGDALDAVAKTRDAGSITRPQRAVTMRGDKKVPVETDSIREALYDVFHKGGRDAGKAMRQMFDNATGPDGKMDASKFGSIDKDALRDRGAVIYHADTAAMRGADPGIDFKDLEKRGLGKLSRDGSKFSIEMHPGIEPGSGGS